MEAVLAVSAAKAATGEPNIERLAKDAI